MMVEQAMPKAFFCNQRKKLPERVTLKGPGGNTWEVGLTINSGTMFFDEGWGRFLKDHSLKEHDLLVFKYNGVSHFEVLIFDGETFCERASSYFVKKTEQRKAPLENGSHPKRMHGGNSSGVVMATPVAQVMSTSLEKTADNDIGSTVPSSRAGHTVVKNVTGTTPVSKPSIPTVWMNKHLPLLLKHAVVLKMKDKTWTTKFNYQQSRKSGGLSAGWKSFAAENNLDEFDVCVFEPDAPFYTSISLNVKIVRVIQDE
ncbi:unnamed protein product [Linum tenue]|uniref:TF-B3 domain-containing protein n=1 Tax=Linum tenue TaxID=586396 RepID=A0AAV0P4Y3_9ROSI|nr:unnamed protein product [Linum tenue]